MKKIRVSRVGLGCLLCFVFTCHASPKTWTGAVSTDWFDPANWDGGVPGIGETAVADASAVRHILLTNETAEMASFTLTGRTVTFSNWTTRLRASMVTLESGAALNLPGAFANAGMSNRVHIVCTNLLVATNALIDANAAGYRGAAGPGCGVNGGAGGGGGAGHAGAGGFGGGGTTSGGNPYGTPGTPVAPGSGGGNGNVTGASGGGAVLIEATGGTVTVYGTIRANAAHATNRDGGGSGGSIWIRCTRFRGSVNGLISANGGNGHNNQRDYSGGGGSGGRITVEYDPAAQAGEPRPPVRFSTLAGTCGFASRVNGGGAWGSVFLTDTAFLSETLAGAQFANVDVYFDGITTWSLNQLDVNNISVRLRDPVAMTVSGNVTIRNSGIFAVQVDNGFSCSDDLVCTNGGRFYAYSGPTNSGTAAYGGLVQIAGRIRTYATSWVHAMSDQTNGGSVVFRAGAVECDTGSGFTANGGGYRRGFGPGKGKNGGGGGGSGGGYGGAGGTGASQSGGVAYGNRYAPVRPGSPGGDGYGYAEPGGGVLWIEALQGVVRLEGTLAANGASRAPSRSGGGSGGGILVACRSFEGVAGIVRANGANGDNNEVSYYSGGGGGGRISIIQRATRQAVDQALTGVLPSQAVEHDSLNKFAGTVEVNGGAPGYPSSTTGYGVAGSIKYLTLPSQGTIIMLR